MNDMGKKPIKVAQFGVRVTAEELAMLERAAAAVHLSLGTYVRQKALTAAEREDPETRRRRVAALMRRARSLPALDRGDE